jgi:hypothetical protein
MLQRIKQYNIKLMFAKWTHKPMEFERYSLNTIGPSCPCSTRWYNILHCSISNWRKTLVPWKKKCGTDVLLKSVDSLGLTACRDHSTPLFWRSALSVSLLRIHVHSLSYMHVYRHTLSPLLRCPSCLSLSPCPSHLFCAPENSSSKPQSRMIA